MMQFATFVFASLCLGAFAVTVDTDGKSEKWTYLIFAQFWPATSCVYFGDSGCIVPPQVRGWTIHGLWPSVPGTELPQYCNDSMKFNATEIQSLRPKLDVMWPYYNRSGDRTELWAHEWDKHGTCAYTLPAVQGELNYFNKTLSLYSQTTNNIAQILAHSKILPSPTEKVLPEKVFDAVKKAHGKVPIVACFYDKKDRQPYLDQVWICFDKEFKQIDCPPVSEPVTTRRHGRRNRETLLFDSEAARGGSEKAARLGNYFLDCEQNKAVWYKPIPHTASQGSRGSKYHIDISQTFQFQYEHFTFRKKD